MLHPSFVSKTLIFGSFLSFASTGYGVFVDGEGHYGFRGVTITNPGFAKYRGMYQAVEQSFRFNLELRANDRLSSHLELRLFEDPRRALLGDTAEPEDCSSTQNVSTNEKGEKVLVDSDGSSDKEQYNKNTGSSSNCKGRHQNTGEPGYQSIQPLIKKAYVTYAFNYCLLEAGRRGRDWGLGIFLDSGNDPFDTGSSTFDGVTCNINIQKLQTLGFSFGYDKLAETGSSIAPGNHSKDGFGPAKGSDDIDQYFLAIMFDNRKVTASTGFSRQIGIYYSNAQSKQSKTDVKIADLFTGFYIGDWALRSETIFRLGKSADPNWSRLGGVSTTYEETAPDADTSPHTNKLDAMALALDLEWTMSQSGSYQGPKEYNQGTFSRHLLFSEYAYAPGDRDGYVRDRDPLNNDEIIRKNNQVNAIAFHRNYKPALLLFNGRPDLDDLRMDGVFDPERVMNTILFTFGYRYESIENGNFETKLISAQFEKSMPRDIKSSYVENDNRPVGTFGSHLGYELDLKYWRNISKELEFGFAGGIGLPGKAWDTRRNSGKTNSFLLQSHVSFNF